MPEIPGELPEDFYTLDAFADDDPLHLEHDEMASALLARMTVMTTKTLHCFLTCNLSTKRFLG